MEIITCTFFAVMACHEIILVFVENYVKDLLSMEFKLFYYNHVNFDNEVDIKLNSRVCNGKQIRFNYTSNP